MSLYTSRSAEKYVPGPVTEFDILKASHKFLRDDTEAEASTSSWNDQLAKKYYDSLYREFALCNLKHYKSGNFSLRWRTENEVLDGTGEKTCANMRCGYHRPHFASTPPLTTLELPFAYEEQGAMKQALVKVVLCPKCVRKLMWKRTQEKRMEEKGKGVELAEDGKESRERGSDEDPGEGDSGERKRDRRPSSVSPPPGKRRRGR
ncbi:folate-sensitive fragile site protein Fra10Ac1-domain-containing protein [Scleroderma citrinum]